MIEVAAEYSVALLVIALGVPPPNMFEFARAHGIKWARLWVRLIMRSIRRERALMS